MCDVFEQIYQRGYKEGYYKSKLNSIHSIMSSLDISMEKAMDILEVSEEEKEYIKQLHQD